MYIVMWFLDGFLLCFIEAAIHRINIYVAMIMEKGSSGDIIAQQYRIPKKKVCLTTKHLTN